MDPETLGSDTITRKAACSCGSLSVICTGEPALVALCHCLECQKRTGGPFGVAAFFAETSVVVDGPTTEYRRMGDSGHEIEFHFCPNCGSTVYWRPHLKPGLVAVAIGAFADPDFPAPSKAVYTQHRHPWAALETKGG